MGTVAAMAACRARATLFAMVAPVAAAMVLSPGVPAAGAATASSPPAASSKVSTAAPGVRLQRAVDDLARLPGGGDGVPGVVVLVDRNGRQSLYRAGSSVAGGPPIDPADRMRLASVSKAYSGAVALALVAHRRLSLRDTVGKWLPSLPKAWSRVTLAQLLQHTSGIPDFSQTDAFRDALLADPLDAPPPIRLLSFAGTRLLFTPGREYHYSNSDNVIAALMAEAATGDTYEQELEAQVFAPLRLGRTSLPRGATMDEPFVHGYALDPPNRPEDVTEAFAAGWSWASGGLVSTPGETDTFVRAYVRGEFGDRRTRSAQFEFRPGSSEPPGPGQNSAGLALFRYRTSCGTVYGHTGNTAGFTQFAAATSDGSRSVVVSVNVQINPTSAGTAFERLQRVYELGVCAALGRGAPDRDGT